MNKMTPVALAVMIIGVASWIGVLSDWRQPVLAVGPSTAVAHLTDTPPTIGDDTRIYEGTFSFKQPELGCNFTGDPASGRMALAINGNSALMQLVGSDQGLRLALSCPTGWSADLQWIATIHSAELYGQYDGSGTLDEITVNGRIAYEFSYQYRNCTTTAENISCPEDRTENGYEEFTFYGKFADAEETRVTAGSAIDRFNRRWGFWGVTFDRVRNTVNASVERLTADVLVNGASIATADLQRDDVLGLRRVAGSADLPKARVTCQSGPASGQSADFTYVEAPDLVSLINNELWDSAPQIVADWPTVCELSSAIGGAAVQQNTIQRVATGALLVTLPDSPFPALFATEVVTVATTGTNVFVLAHSPETETSLVAAFGGPLEIIPSDTELSPFRLRHGEMITVETSVVGPVMALDQLYLPIVRSD